MISGSIGFFLNAFSITLLAAVLVIALTSILLLFDFWQRLKLSAAGRRRALWMIVLAPWIAGLLTTLIVVTLSQPGIAILFESDIIHWHHLKEFYWNSWHGGLVVAMLILFALMLSRLLRRINSVAKTIDLLSELSGSRADGVLELDSDICAAFTAGVKNPHCYMTRALIEQLNETEYDVIRIHEMAHVDSKDPANRALFYVLAGLFPAAIAHFLMSQMITATEQIADAKVTESNSDRAFIARVLLKVHRLSSPSSIVTEPTMGICQFGIDSIDLRIRYLLSENQGSRFSFVIAIVLIGMLAFVCALSIDALHHAIELPWQHNY